MDQQRKLPLDPRHERRHRVSKPVRAQLSHGAHDPLRALIALALLARCTPPDARTEPARAPIALAPSPDAALSSEPAQPLAAPPADRPEADEPFASVVAPAGVLHEASERATARLRREGVRFRVRAINFDGVESPSQQRVDLARIATVDEGSRESPCVHGDPVEPSEAARTAGLRAFVRSMSSHRRPSDDPDELARQLAAAATPTETATSCPSRLGNALYFATLDEQDPTILRVSGGVVRPFAQSVFGQTTFLQGIYHLVDDSIALDLNGDQADDALVLYREYEGTRRFVETYIPDSPRAARIAIEPERCPADCADYPMLDCRDGSYPAVYALFDQDRWILRVGLETYRANDAGAALLRAPPRSPELAAWLASVRRTEEQLRALARELSRDSDQLGGNRPRIAAALRALGEAPVDVERAMRGLFERAQ